MKGVASLRRLLIAVSAVCLVTAAPARVSALEPIPPPSVQYVVQGFGADPLGSAGPRLRISLDPPEPDSYFGWYRSPVRIALLPDRPAGIKYAWDDPAGAWHPYQAPILAPEGKHVLYAQADDGKPGPLVALQVKLDFRSPARPTQEAAGAPARPLAAGTTTGSAVVNVTASANPFAGPRVIRVWGQDRYGTCGEIGRKDFPAGAATAILARGDDFPDALASAPLAGLYNAPIVLTKPTSLPDASLRMLADLGIRRAVIIGDEHAVSRGVERQLVSRGISFERIGGKDRYGTAALIASAVVARGGEKGAAFVARGDQFPDSLAVSPLAFRAKRPILLVRPTSLPPVTKQALGALAINTIVIAGSDAAVSPGVEDNIRATHVSISRAEGENRYGTAAAAARYGEAAGLGDFRLVGIATGEDFPDALCGGAAMGSLGGVILMTPKGHLAAETAAELRAHGPKLRDVQVFGSERTIAKLTWDQLLDAVR